MNDFQGNDDEKNFLIKKINAYGRLNEFLQAVEASHSRQDMIKEWARAPEGERIFDLRLEDLAEVSTSEQRLKKSWQIIVERLFSETSWTFFLKSKTLPEG